MRRTSFELLEDVVRVEIEQGLLGSTSGLSSFVISYKDFRDFLEESQREEEVQNTEDMDRLQRYWSEGGEVFLPEGTIEVKTSTGATLHIRQLIGGNQFPLLKVLGEYVDTSRVLVDFKINNIDKVIEDVEVYTFTGMMYGFHKEDNITPNQFLTLKLKEDMEGKEVEGLKDIKTEDIIMKVLARDIRRSRDGSFEREVERVKQEGGQIKWQEVQC